MKRALTSLPGLPPLIACFGAAGGCGRALRASSASTALPPAYEALRELPAILSDRESLLNILVFGAPHGDRLRAGARLCDPGRADDGAQPQGRGLLQSALLMMIYPVPKAALMPIIMLWLGIGDASKTLVIFLGVSACR